MNGIERIKQLASEITDKALLKIINYLISRSDMSEKYLNEEKNIKQMIDFIKSLAEKESENGIAIIDDDIVYGWAIHYWDEPNEKLKLDKAETNYSDAPVKSEMKSKIIKSKEWKAEGQLTLFD